MKSQKGITLIAVIITIIAMIILAGVSVTMTVGNDGILQNSQKATEDTEISASKAYILEAWAYVLAKCEEMPVITYYNNNKNQCILTEEEFKVFSKASSVFGKYISNYGEGILENKICCIKIEDTNVTKFAYKIAFDLDGSAEVKNFYIVDDTKVYEEKEFIKFVGVPSANELDNREIKQEVIQNENTIK